MPSNVTLCLRQYSEGEFDQDKPIYSAVTGDGKIDSRYDWTVRYMSILSEVESPKAARETESDYAKLLQEYAEKGYGLYPEDECGEEVNPKINVSNLFSSTFTRANFLTVRDKIEPTLKSKLSQTGYESMSDHFDRWHKWVKDVLSEPVLQKKKDQEKATAPVTPLTPVTPATVPASQQMGAQTAPDVNSLKKNEEEQSFSICDSVAAFFSSCFSCCCGCCSTCCGESEDHESQLELS